MGLAFDDVSKPITNTGSDASKIKARYPCPHSSSFASSIRSRNVLRNLMAVSSVGNASMRGKVECCVMSVVLNPSLWMQCFRLLWSFQSGFQPNCFHQALRQTSAWQQVIQVSELVNLSPQLFKRQVAQVFVDGGVAVLEQHECLAPCLA